MAIVGPLGVLSGAGFLPSIPRLPKTVGLDFKVKANEDLNLNLGFDFAAYRHGLPAHQLVMHA